MSNEKSKSFAQLTKLNRNFFPSLKIFDFFFSFLFSHYHFSVKPFFSCLVYISLIILLWLKLFFFLYLLCSYFCFTLVLFFHIYCYLLKTISMYLEVFQATYIKQYNLGKINNRQYCQSDQAKPQFSIKSAFIDTVYLNSFTQRVFFPRPSG